MTVWYRAMQEERFGLGEEKKKVEIDLRDKRRALNDIRESFTYPWAWGANPEVPTRGPAG